MGLTFAIYCVVALLALPIFLTTFDLRSELMLGLAVIAAAIWPISIPAWLVSRALGGH